MSPERSYFNWFNKMQHVIHFPDSKDFKDLILSNITITITTEFKIKTNHTTRLLKTILNCFHNILIVLQWRLIREQSLLPGIGSSYCAQIVQYTKL